jgi:hypothetical protein
MALGALANRAPAMGNQGLNGLPAELIEVLNARDVLFKVVLSLREEWLAARQRSLELSDQTFHLWIEPHLIV